MTAELEPCSKVEVFLEEILSGEPRCWVKVQQPGMTKPEEMRYPVLMSRLAVTKEDKAVKQEASRQYRALMKEWRAKASSKTAPTLEVLNVVSDRSPFSDDFDPTRHLTVYYKLNGEEHHDVPASMDRMLRASPERFPPDAADTIRNAVRDKLGILMKQCRVAEAARNGPQDENKLGTEQAPNNASTTVSEALLGIDGDKDALGGERDGLQPEKSSGGLRGELEGHGIGNALGITSTQDAVTEPPRGASAYNNVVNDSSSAGPEASKSIEEGTQVVHPAIAEAERINELLAIGRDEAREGGPTEIPTQEPIQACSGYSLDLAEPYIEDDGSPAVAMIWNGLHIKLWRLSEWKETEPSLYKDLVKRFFPERGQRWRYPSRPIIPESYDDIWGEDNLHTAIMRCNERYIEFPDKTWPSVFATWIIGSYLVPFLPRSPILPIFGPTGSGKGQVLDQVDRLAYRGKKMLDPTPAILYRLADRWRMTFALDELQDKDKDSFREVLSIVKGSYDGTSVFRCDMNNDVEEFQTRSFFALSFKDHHPKEDVKNRGILLTMQQNGASKSLVPEDSPEHVELRARLMGLRLKALSDPQFLEEAINKVQELGTPEALGFDRRPRDIAVSLLLPAVMGRQEEELIKVVRESSAEALDANNSTFEARVQHAYEELIGGLNSVVRYYPVLTIRAHLEELLRADGELKDNQKLPTRRVTYALKTLGYLLVRRSGNNPFIDREAEQNVKAFEANRRKYALGEDDAEAA